jgi:hypothetical protein
MVVYRIKRESVATITPAVMRPAVTTATKTPLAEYIARINTIIKALNETKDKQQALSRLTTLKQEILVVKQTKA